MSLPTFSKVAGRWFLDDFCGTISSNGYFNCAVPSCPFSVKVTFKDVDGNRVPDGVEHVVFSQHCHEMKENPKYQNKRFLMAEIMAIETGEDDGTLATKHQRWQEQASEEGRAIKKEFVERQATIRYACERPHLSGREVANNTV